MRISRPRKFRKHPRIRGENRLFITSYSSVLRNIPAYAGRTYSRRSACRSCEKHPRIRGENSHESSTLSGQKETSPHTRGELIQDDPPVDRVRNIPAYAGRTSAGCREADAHGKHPRIRGENANILILLSRLVETSPHTRGEQQHIESLIPFCTVFSM